MLEPYKDSSFQSKQTVNNIETTVAKLEGKTDDDRAAEGQIEALAIGEEASGAISH